MNAAVEVGLDSGYTTPAISQSTSAEKPTYPRAITVGSVELRFAADFRQTPGL